MDAALILAELTLAPDLCRCFSNFNCSNAAMVACCASADRRGVGVGEGALAAVEDALDWAGDDRPASAINAARERSSAKLAAIAAAISGSASSNCWDAAASVRAATAAGTGAKPGDGRDEAAAAVDGAALLVLAPFPFFFAGFVLKTTAADGEEDDAADAARRAAGV